MLPHDSVQLNCVVRGVSPKSGVTVRFGQALMMVVVSVLQLLLYLLLGSLFAPVTQTVLLTLPEEALLFSCVVRLSNKIVLARDWHYLCFL